MSESEHYASIAKGQGSEQAPNSKGLRTLRALQALATDTIDGHGQKASEAEGSTALGQRGRSMRMKVSSSRLEALNAAARCRMLRRRNSSVGSWVRP